MRSLYHLRVAKGGFIWLAGLFENGGGITVISTTEKMCLSPCAEYLSQFNFSHREGALIKENDTFSIASPGSEAHEPYKTEHIDANQAERSRTRKRDRMLHVVQST